jgi:O-antigen/teichoic acid export membrane protein
MNEALTAIEMVTLPILVLLLVFADDLVTMIGGQKFTAAGPVLRILAIGLALSFINGVYGQALVALGRQSVLFRVSVLVLGVNIVLNVVAIPMFGARGAAAALAVSELVALVASRTLYAREAPPPENRMRWRMVAAAATMTVALPFKGVAAHSVASLFAGAALASACYLAALIALGALPQVITDQWSAAVGRVRRLWAP